MTLIGECDKPIIDYIEEKDRLKAEENRRVLKNFYSVIKDLDDKIKLLFITGVSKFSKVLFFSELNNLTDITLNENFSQIIDYTEKEIKDNYNYYLKIVEDKFKIDRDQLFRTLSYWYNGYSWDGENFLYNPYSVLNLLYSCSFKNYWFNNGTPTFLTKMIRKQNIEIDNYESSLDVESDLLDSNEDNIDFNIILFQTGYLTIKKRIINSDDFSESYKLTYPNREVRDSFYIILSANSRE